MIEVLAESLLAIADGYSPAVTVLSVRLTAVANPSATNNSLDFILLDIPINPGTFENTVNENICQIAVKLS